MNLLINATQAIAPGNVHENQIRVSIKNATGLVIVEIADTGSGIPAENLERIFDPFFTTKPVGLGTGLGLSICHSIIAAFGGDLTVTSQVGRGSTFRVSLPSTDQPLRSLMPPEDRRRVSRAARILVVDPEPAITKAMRRILSAHKVETADSGLEALTICQERRFDLVLYDLRTADLSGPDMYRRLQEAGDGCERRLVFTNAGTIPSAVDAFLAETKLPKMSTTPRPHDAGLLRPILDQLRGGAPPRLSPPDRRAGAGADPPVRRRSRRLRRPGAAPGCCCARRPRSARSAVGLDLSRGMLATGARARPARRAGLADQRAAAVGVGRSGLQHEGAGAHPAHRARAGRAGPPGAPGRPPAAGVLQSRTRCATWPSAWAGPSASPRGPPTTTSSRATTPRPRRDRTCRPTWRSWACAASAS